MVSIGVGFPYVTTLGPLNGRLRIVAVARSWARLSLPILVHRCLSVTEL